MEQRQRRRSEFLQSIEEEDTIITGTEYDDPLLKNTREDT